MKTLNYGLHMLVLSLFVVSAIGYGFLTIGSAESRNVMVSAMTSHSCMPSELPASSITYKMHSCPICADHSLSVRHASLALNGAETSMDNKLLALLDEVKLPSLQASIVAWLSQYVPDSDQEEPLDEQSEVYVLLFGK